MLTVYKYSVYLYNETTLVYNYIGVHVYKEIECTCVLDCYLVIIAKKQFN